MASSYASAFDDLLAAGRKQLDKMTGGRSEREAMVPAEAAGEAAEESGGTVVSGTMRGTPFRLTVR